MNIVPANGVTSLNRFLRMAVMAGVESAVQIHIDRGDDLNVCDERGQTPLMLSAARNKAGICKILLAAGADATLLDPSGRSALDIAQAAGASEAASVIEAAYRPLAASCDSNVFGVAEPVVPDGQLVQVATDPPTMIPVEDSVQTTEQSPSLFGVEAAATIIEWDSFEDGDSFNLTGWEPEKDQSPPKGDATISAAAFVIQSAISEHQPIDTSTDWDDVETFLPDRAQPLSRADDIESREQLRLVLLRAIREGSVPHTAVEDLTRNDNGEPNQEAEALLSMVINDLGAETDERFEYVAPDESFEVFVAPGMPDEEEAVSDALLFVDELASYRNDPLRMYLREFQRGALLTADAEVALGQAMERSLEKALDALAGWPFGIGAVLDAVSKVASGGKPLRWLSSGSQAELKDDAPVSGANSDLSTEVMGLEEDESQSGLGTKESIDELANLCNCAKMLSDFPITEIQEDSQWSSRRGVIASLGLTRNFFMELADTKLSEESTSALAFVQAMNAYRCARDQMTVANLKLVFSIAKKYLFSGLPLDDLLQEGNIGLIKAVDRYDWRRGFKFSTYATWWIRQQVGRYVADKSKMIRLPVHLHEQIQRFAHASQAFELEHGRAPTFEEIASLMDISVRKVATLARASFEPIAIHGLDDLDKLIAADANDQFMLRDPMEIVQDIQLIDLVDRLLGDLSRKEQCVMRLRFGIGIQDSLTLDEIGQRFEVTRERIRQIEVAALRKLKNPALLNQIIQGELKGTRPQPSNQRSKTTSLRKLKSSNRFDKLQRDLKAESPELSNENSDTLDYFDDDDVVQKAIGVALKSSSTSLVPAAFERQKIGDPMALEEALEQARTAGITVMSYFDGSLHKTWVGIPEVFGSEHGKLIQNLIELGFNFQLGKGYFR